MNDTDKPQEQRPEEQQPPGERARDRMRGDRPRPAGGKVPSLDDRDLGMGNVPNLRQLDAELERELADAMSGVGDMEALMGGGRRQKAPPKPEGPRKGKVMSVRGKDVFIDVGGRTQGVLPTNQFPEGLPEIGTEVEFTIEGYDPDGVLILSRGGQAIEADWSTVATGMLVEAKVTAANKGGLEVEVNGIRGFMPISQIEMHRVEDISGYVGQKLRCFITEVDREDRNLLVSRKALLEKDREEAGQKTWASLAEGDIREGVVRTIKPFGAFVDLGGVDGLVPIGEMSWTRIKTPEDVLQPGQRVKVKVLRIDPDTRKLTLGLKQLTTGPWELAVANYPPGTVVAGVVTRLADYGAFVEVEPGLEGLVHVSEVSQQRIRRPHDVLKEGQSVNVKVLNVDPGARRMSLSIKAASAKAAEAAALVEEAEPEPEEPAAPVKPRVRTTPLRGGTGGGGPLFQLPKPPGEGGA